MTQEEKDKIKAQIKRDIELLSRQIALLEEKTKPVTPDCSLGRLTRLEAMGEQHVNHKILDEDKLRFTRLNNALARIDKPMFGICIECEDKIATERMMIRPESIRCVECANEHC